MVEGIEVTRDGSGVVTVALARPEKRNAVTLAMWRALKPLFDGFGADPSVRVVILTGRGGNFCAGADISEFATVRTGPATVAAEWVSILPVSGRDAFAMAKCPRACSANGHRAQQDPGTPCHGLLPDRHNAALTPW